MEIPVVIQQRHVHLSASDAVKLFGIAEIHSARNIDQRGQSLFPKTVSVHGPTGFFEQVCVIGPVRAQTQVELSVSDAHAIGLKPHLRVSGDVERCSTTLLKTALGQVRAKSSTIVPIRHLHLPPSVAKDFKLSHHDIVSLPLKNDKEIIFEHVVVRVHPTFIPAFHLTTDEAASRWIQTGDRVLLQRSL